MAITNWLAIDSAFKSVCRTLFGREVGDLKDFEPYLKEYMFPHVSAKSYISGKEVFMSNDLYPKNGRFASMDELKSISSKEFSINDIKDIDSLFRAATEHAVYCGNKTHGININFGRVDNAIDCSDIYCTHTTHKVRRSAYVSCIRESEYVFGTPAFPKIRHSIRCIEGLNISRAFESHYITNCSDMYFSFNCANSNDCIFAFNQRAKRNIIGNLELEAAKYHELKKKLISEMADELARNKRLFSIKDLAFMGVEKDRENEIEIPPAPAPKNIKEAFGETTKLLLGKERQELEEYSPWLKQNSLRVWKIKGKFGSPSHKVGLPIIRDFPAEKLCTLEEAFGKGGKPLIDEMDCEMPLFALAKKVAKDMVTTVEYIDGRCENTPDVSAVFDSTNVYSMWDATNSNLSACTTAAIESQYIFGGHLRILHSQFCINCYDPYNLKLCYEVDGSSNCNGCYFCHNIEGCEDCIFCFNAKGLHRAVFNKEVGKEEYERIKKMLLDYINCELDLKKSVGRTIFRL